MFLAREPWFHVRTEPNGNVVIRYGGGAERIVTPAGKFKARWPGSWNTGRSMYRWMARSALHVTAVQLVRADVDSPWVCTSNLPARSREQSRLFCCPADADAVFAAWIDAHPDADTRTNSTKN